MDSHTYSRNGVTWNVVELWKAAEGVSAEKMQVCELVRHLGRSSWGSGIPVLEFLEHTKRMGEADMSFPILMGEGKIVDGTHRLCKAVLEGRKEVQVQIIEMPEPTEVLKSRKVWRVVHNIVAHPLMEIWPSMGLKLHDWTADRM